MGLSIISDPLTWTLLPLLGPFGVAVLALALFDHLRQPRQYFLCATISKHLRFNVNGHGPCSDFGLWTSPGRFMLPNSRMSKNKAPKHL